MAHATWSSGELAEAARNPKVSRLVSEARTQIRQRMCALISVAAPERWTDEDIRKKVDTLQMLLDASSIKAVLDRSFAADQACEEFVTYANTIFERDAAC